MVHDFAYPTVRFCYILRTKYVLYCRWMTSRYKNLGRVFLWLRPSLPPSAIRHPQCGDRSIVLRNNRTYLHRCLRFLHSRLSRRFTRLSSGNLKIKGSVLVHGYSLQNYYTLGLRFPKYALGGSVDTFL
jgi:hypothetical protein